MCNWFTKKGPVPVVRDLVYIDTNTKRQAAYSLLKENPDALMIAWFPDTLVAFQQFMKSRPGIVIPPVYTHQQVTADKVENKLVIFLEHFPLPDKERELMRSWKAKQIIVLNSLDEPLFTNFGSENIMRMMKNLDVDEGTPLEHRMISESIRRVQQQIAKKVVRPISANSQEYWFQMNWNLPQSQ